MAALTGGVIGWLSGPGTHSTYLQLQEASDFVHRCALVALPGLFLLGIGISVTMYFWRDRLRKLWTTLIFASLAVWCGVATYIVRFDSKLESLGLFGQFVYGDQMAHRGNALTGSIKLGSSSMLLFFGTGDYEDDIVITATSAESDTPRWSFHCLGNRAYPPVIDGADLLLSVWRPSGSAITLIDWGKGALVWAVRLDGTIALPARFSSQSIQVATDTEVLRLDRADARIISRQSACTSQSPGSDVVACQAGRVVGWLNQERP